MSNEEGVWGQGSVDQPKVSVIVPVYNMADCLEKGLASIREQVLEPLEIICVDDGSTDTSGDILATIANEDSRVRVISQTNQGAGAARNAALQVAKGEFVAFMDPDDCYPDPSTLQTLYWGAVFNDALICGGSFSEKFDGEIRTEFGGPFAKYTFTEETFIDFQDYQFDYGYTRFLYNLDFLKEHGIEFPTYRRYQDPPFMAQALATAGKFLAIPELAYQYSQHDYSQMNWSRDQLNDNLRGMIHQLRFSSKHGFAQLHRLTYERFNKDFFDRIWAQIDSEHNSPEEAESTYELLHEAASALDVYLLNESMGLNRSEYYLRPLQRATFDDAGNLEYIEASVVVPAYNAEAYLGDCLESLRDQTLTDFEIIVVDDGSWDSTPFILEDAAATDSRIQVVTCHEHTNAACARNIALEHVRGPYVLFFEADATADPDMLRTLVDQAKAVNADIVMFGMGEHDLSSDEKRKKPSALRIKEMPKEQPFSAEQATKKIFNCGAVTALNKLFKTDFVRSQNLRFQEISSCNDVFFTCSALSRAQKIVAYDEVLVHHKVGIPKALAENVEYHTSNYFYALKALHEDLVERQVFEKFEQSYVNFAMDFAFGMRSIFQDAFANLIERQLIKRDIATLNLAGYPDDFYYYPHRVQMLDRLMHRESSPSFLCEYDLEGPHQQEIAVSVLVSSDTATIRELVLTLDSVQYQWEENIEILVAQPVDKKAAIELALRAETDSRIRIIDRGATPGESLNTALSVAQGHYVLVIEAGDFMDVFQILTDGRRAVIDSVDALWDDRLLIRHHPDAAMLFERRNATLDGADVSDESLSSRSVLTGSLLRREFLEKKSIAFSSGPLRFIEAAFVAQVVALGAICGHSDSAMYYRANRGEGRRDIAATQGEILLAAFEAAKVNIVSNSAPSGAREDFARLHYRALNDVLEKMEKSSQRDFAQKVATIIKPALDSRFIDRSGLTKSELVAARSLASNPDAYYARELSRRVKASIIVPVFNVQRFLRHGLHTLQKQSVENIEIICVDDASDDHSMHILHDAADRDDRIVVLSQLNRGAGAARNKGMDVARGQYLAFVDSDDWVSEKLVEKMTAHMEQYNADICVFGQMIFHDYVTGERETRQKVRMHELPDKPVFSHNDLGSHVFTWCHGNASDKFFKRAFVEAADLKFQEQRTTNDHYFTRAAIMLASRITVIDEPLYTSIRNTPTSLQASRELSWRCFYDALCADRDLLIRTGLYERYEQEFVNFALATCMWNWRTLQEPERSQLARQFREGWLAELDILGRGRAFFTNRTHYGELQAVLREADEDAPVEISVIIPCFNAGDYIGETLDSLIGQTFGNFEILCIDDGSTDNTMNVCRQYAERDNRIRVIVEESAANRGPGATRNIGLEIACGKYVYFMDSDDLLTPNCFERLHSLADENALDLIYFEADSFYETPELEMRHANYKEAYHRQSEYPDIYEGPKLFKRFSQNPGNDFKVSVCLQFVRRSHLEENSIRLPALSMHVDDVYSVETLLAANRVMVLPDRLYLRRVREGSVITRKSSQLRRVRAATGVLVNLLRIMAKYESGTLAHSAVARRFDILSKHVEFLYDRLTPKLRQEVLAGLDSDEAAALQVALLRRKVWR